MEKMTTKKLIIVIAIGIGLFAIAQNLANVFGFVAMLFGVITPLIVGGCIAFVINVPMSFFEDLFLEKCKFKTKKVLKILARPIALVLSILILGAVLLVLTLIVFPEVANTILSLSNNIPIYVDNIVKWSKDLYEQYPQIAERLQALQINWTEISSTALQILKATAEAILGSTVTIASSVVGGVISFFLSFVLSIYILFQKEKISIHAKRALFAFIPEVRVKQVLRIGQLTSNTFSRFLSGQCIEACILGSMVFISMSIFNFPYALMISALIAVFSFIPMFGVYIACSFGALLMLLQGDPMQAVLFFLMFVVIQQIEGNLIYPHVVGSSVGLSPIIVLSAIIVGGGLLGFVGMLVSVPLSAVLCALYKELISRRLKRRLNEARAKKAQQDMADKSVVSD